MTRVTRETTIRAAPDLVFRHLTDPAERAQWLTSMTESPTDPTLRVGSKVPARRKDPSSTSKYEMTVTKLENARKIETSIKRNGSSAGSAGYDLAPAADGTRVVAFAEFELPFLARMMAPVVEANLRKELDLDLASLKKHVESKA